MGVMKKRGGCTLGETGTQETGDLLDETIGSKEGIVLAGKLLDELLVLVQLLEVISGHGVNAVVLSTVKIVLVTENTVLSTWSATCSRNSLIIELFFVFFDNFFFSSKICERRTRWTCRGEGRWGA